MGGTMSDPLCRSIIDQNQSKTTEIAQTLIKNGPKSVQKLIKMCQNGPKWAKICPKLIKMGQNLSNIDQNGPKWAKMCQNVQNLSKIDQNRPK